jgi:cephalosporin hydroxylase
VTETFPRPVRAALGETIREYWIDRVRQHTEDLYAGVPIAKFPEDLRVYEHLIWNARPNVVIELGTQHGGSALWFRDRLRALASYHRLPNPRVISIDVDVAAARSNLEARDPSYGQTIDLVEGDVLDPSLPALIADRLPADSRCLVVEDSLHTYETTIAALRGFARFVPPGGFFVVEDGCVDIEEMRISEDWPRGVLPALHEWLGSAEGSAFQIRRGRELYGVSCHPEGFWERVR